MKKKSKRKIAEVLCDSGESPIGAAKGQTLQDVLDTGGRMLDKACLTNVIVVRDYKGRHYVGEFLFMLHPTSRKEAQRVAKDFSNEE